MTRLMLIRIIFLGLFLLRTPLFVHAAVNDFEEFSLKEKLGSRYTTFVVQTETDLRSHELFYNSWSRTYIFNDRRGKLMSSAIVEVIHNADGSERTRITVADSKDRTIGTIELAHNDQEPESDLQDEYYILRDSANEVIGHARRFEERGTKIVVTDMQEQELVFAERTSAGWVDQSSGGDQWDFRYSTQPGKVRYRYLATFLAAYLSRTQYVHFMTYSKLAKEWARPWVKPVVRLAGAAAVAWVVYKIAGSRPKPPITNPINPPSYDEVVTGAGLVGQPTYLPNPSLRPTGSSYYYGYPDLSNASAPDLEV